MADGPRIPDYADPHFVLVLPDSRPDLIEYARAHGMSYILQSDTWAERPGWPSNIGAEHGNRTRLRHRK